MLRKLVKGAGGIYLCSNMPFHLTDYDNKVPRNSKTAEDIHNSSVTETGKDRLYAMFSVDEFGGMSSEITTIYQTSFMGFLTGAVYGGFIQSKAAYVDFMESNQATAFKSHFDAKKKLQDQVTISFAKGAVRWGWRLALFTTTYVGIVTTMSVYRGKSSIYEYLTAGAIAGSMYKINNGLRGMTVGGLLGFGLGGVAGLVSLMILKLSGTSMEEVRYWQYNWKKQRDQSIREAEKANLVAERDPLLDTRDPQFATKENTLNSLDQESDKNVEKK